WSGHRLRQYDNTATLHPPSGDPSSVGADLDAIAGDTAVPIDEHLPPYAVSGTASVGHVNERSDPSTANPAVTTDNEGTTLDIVCQTTGESVGNDTVWDQLLDGNSVSDLYTTSPGGLGYAGTLPQCATDTTRTARITTPY